MWKRLNRMSDDSTAVLFATQQTAHTQLHPICCAIFSPNKELPHATYWCRMESMKKPTSKPQWSACSRGLDVVLNVVCQTRLQKKKRKKISGKPMNIDWMSQPSVAGDLSRSEILKLYSVIETIADTYSPASNWISTHTPWPWYSQLARASMFMR